MDLKWWPALTELLTAAESLQPLQVWLFGSALRCDKPADLDVLLVYNDRALVRALRSTQCWDESNPPCHIIAMTALEVIEYDFLASTHAVRLL